jgi:hypothetical protein
VSSEENKVIRPIAWRSVRAGDWLRRNFLPVINPRSGAKHRALQKDTLVLWIGGTSKSIISQVRVKENGLDKTGGFKTRENNIGMTLVLYKP